MNAQDLSFMIFYGVCGLVCLIIGIIGLVKAKTKDEITNAWLTILVSFTPGVVLIGMLLLMVGFFLLISQGPSWLICKLKKIEND